MSQIITRTLLQLDRESDRTHAFKKHVIRHRSEESALIRRLPKVKWSQFRLCKSEDKFYPYKIMRLPDCMQCYTMAKFRPDPETANLGD